MPCPLVIGSIPITTNHSAKKKCWKKIEKFFFHHFELWTDGRWKAKAKRKKNEFFSFFDRLTSISLTIRFLLPLVLLPIVGFRSKMDAGKFFTNCSAASASRRICLSINMGVIELGLHGWLYSAFYNNDLNIEKINKLPFWDDKKKHLPEIDLEMVLSIDYL